MTYIQYRDINNCMEERVINILLDIKADIGELKKGQFELKTRIDKVETNLGGRMDKLESRMGNLESDVSELKSDMSEVKSTVNALGDALLDTSREVKQIKAKKG
ncbi:MAG: DUF1515 family protein [Deltaproteobacteria bacterium]|nr:DUF1515 family protein [Deltaproteobacteria bacterium]